MVRYIPVESGRTDHENVCFWWSCFVYSPETHTRVSLGSPLNAASVHVFVAPAGLRGWTGHTMRAKRQAPTHAALRLRHSSSGGAVAQAGALLWVLERRGDRQAGRHGDREAGCHCGGWWQTSCQLGRGRFVRATVLQQDVHALLAPCVLSQSQRGLPLRVPMPDVTAVLETEQIELNWAIDKLIELIKLTKINLNWQLILPQQNTDHLWPSELL